MTDYYLSEYIVCHKNNNLSNQDKSFVIPFKNLYRVSGYDSDVSVKLELRWRRGSYCAGSQ